VRAVCIVRLQSGHAFFRVDIRLLRVQGVLVQEAQNTAVGLRRDHRDFQLHDVIILNGVCSFFPAGPGIKTPFCVDACRGVFIMKPV
jgi:hypothetical protein